MQAELVSCQRDLGWSQAVHEATRTELARCQVDFEAKQEELASCRMELATFREDVAELQQDVRAMEESLEGNAKLTREVEEHCDSAPIANNDVLSVWRSHVLQLVRSKPLGIDVGSFPWEWHNMFPSLDIDEYKPCKKLSNAISNYVDEVEISKGNIVTLRAHNGDMQDRVRIHEGDEHNDEVSRQLELVRQFPQGITATGTCPLQVTPSKGLFQNGFQPRLRGA